MLLSDMYLLKQPHKVLLEKSCSKNVIRKREKSGKLIMRTMMKNSCKVDYYIFYYSI